MFVALFFYLFSAAFLNWGSCWAHSSLVNLDLALQSLSVNLPSPVKPPHNGTFAPNCTPYLLYVFVLFVLFVLFSTFVLFMFGAIPIVCVQLGVHLLILAHPHVPNRLRSMLLSRFQTLWCFCQSDAIEHQVHVLCPPERSVVQFLLHKGLSLLHLRFC